MSETDESGATLTGWFELEFVVGQAQADELSDILLEEGALSVQVLDDDAGTGAEQPVFGEPGMPAAPLGWRASRMLVLCHSEAQGKSVIHQALARLSMAPPNQIECRSVPHQDWVSLTQAQFAPMAIGQRLWVTPTWHADTAADAATHATKGAQRLTIVLDPGMAFGTGSHPTTRLCLSWLDANIQGGETVIDYGCGSGILAIAAAKLGAAQVWGLDIDEQAIQSAAYNAQSNDVALTLSTTREPITAPANIVVANILASPLKVLAPLLEELVRPGGHLILAGLLDTQIDEVAACYRHIQMTAWATEEGWTCLVGTAPSVAID